MYRLLANLTDERDILIQAVMKKLLTSFSLIDCSRKQLSFRKLSVPSQHIESGRNKAEFDHPTIIPLKFSMKDSLSLSPLLQDETMNNPKCRNYLFSLFCIVLSLSKYKGKIPLSCFHNRSYGLCVIMMCQCRCISYNKWTLWWEEIDKVGA